MRLHQSEHIRQRTAIAAGFDSNVTGICQCKTVDPASGVQQVISPCIERMAAPAIFPIMLVCDINQLGIAIHADNSRPADHSATPLKRLRMPRQKAVEVICKRLTIRLA